MMIEKHEIAAAKVFRDFKIIKKIHARLESKTGRKR
jgi:hypothetical protein